MGFLMAGLLQGAGKAVTDIAASKAAQRREDALISLRRQYQKEDTAAENTREDANAERDAKLKVGLLSLANEYKKQEGETEFDYKVRLEEIKGRIEGQQIGQRGAEDRKTEETRSANDAELKVLQSRLDTSRDSADRAEAAKIARGEGKVVGTNPAGYIIIQKGNTLITTRTKKAETGAGGGDEEGGAIAAARRREGVNGKPPVAAKPTVSRDDPETAALWSALAGIPAPDSGQPQVRTMTGAGGKRVEIKWTGQRWQPTRVVT